jgi:hypothetical protein
MSQCSSSKNLEFIREFFKDSQEDIYCVVVSEIVADTKTIEIITNVAYFSRNVKRLSRTHLSRRLCDTPNNSWRSSNISGVTKFFVIVALSPLDETLWKTFQIMEIVSVSNSQYISFSTVCRASGVSRCNFPCMN